MSGNVLARRDWQGVLHVGGSVHASPQRGVVWSECACGWKSDELPASWESHAEAGRLVEQHILAQPRVKPEEQQQ